jgi:predicted DNA binding CopG/RHH family protein
MQKSNYKLDKEEKEILKAFDQGKLKRSLDFPSQKKKLEAYAKNTIEKKHNINIRVSKIDLFRVKSRAAEQGIPYQTLISSLIHQYSNRRIDYNVLREPKNTYKN